MTLVGPFNFEPISISNRVKQKIHRDQWNKLSEVCKFHEILSPTMGTNSSHKVSQIKNKNSNRCKRKRGKQEPS